MSHMSSTELFLVLFLFGLFYLTFRIFLYGRDVSQIETFCRSKGFADVSVKWAPFNFNSLVERNERVYRINYTFNGIRYSAIAKTSLATDVFIGEEQPTSQKL